MIMLIEMHTLIATCATCDNRADYKVTDNGQELPKGYLKTSYSTSYCLKHPPQKAKDFWNYNIPDMPKQQL